MDEVVRLLAASKPGGAFLCLGAAGAALAPRIVEGMDMSARLVVVVDDQETAAALAPDLHADLRVAVHAQDCAAFLRDVSEHRFDLVAAPAAQDPVAALALERLAPGGLYVTREPLGALHGSLAAGAAPAPDGEARAADDVTLAALPGASGLTIVARGPERQRPRRRGGRRSREGVTSIFASKTQRRD